MSQMGAFENGFFGELQKTAATLSTTPTTSAPPVAPAVPVQQPKILRPPGVPKVAGVAGVLPKMPGALGAAKRLLKRPVMAAGGVAKVATGDLMPAPQGAPPQSAAPPAVLPSAIQTAAGAQAMPKVATVRMRGFVGEISGLIKRADDVRVGAQRTV